jgi:hypothetical protein
MSIPDSLRRAASVVVATALPLASGLAQETHIVPPSELHASVIAEGGKRQELRSRLERFFTGESAEKALQTAHLNGSQVRNAIALLDDQDLARLAARAEKASSDFAGGALNNQELTYIIIALGTAVLILIIVAAR